MIELKIDPEFRDKIPAMPQEDFDGLREDILRDGYVRDPLVVWKEENILLDGHHRWKVIEENPYLPYNVDYKSFPDRWAAIAWICANQLHKHNMNEMQKMKLIQEEYEARKNSATFKGNQYVTSGGEEIHHHQNDEPETIFKGSPGKEQKLRPTIAKEHGISEGIVQTAVEVGRGIDRAAEVDPEFKNDVLSGKIKARKSDLAALRKMETDDEVASAIEEIKRPKPRVYTAEDRARAEFIHKINEVQQDIGREIEYTVDDLVNEITVNGKDYVSSLRVTLTKRKELFVGYAIDQVTEAVNQLIAEIEKTKELII